MTAAAVLASLVRLGASIAITPECALTIRAPKGALTPEVLATVRAGKEDLLTVLLTWDQVLADRLLRAALARVAAAYVPTWRRRYAEDAPRWLEVEGRVEAAALTRDMPAFVRALVAYERFALTTFTAWAQEATR